MGLLIAYVYYSTLNRDPVTGVSVADRYFAPHLLIGQDLSSRAGSHFSKASLTTMG